MNSVINTSREEILTQLKNAKGEMLKSQAIARENVAAYFLQLRDITNNCEHQFNLALNSSTLNYHQQLTELCKTIGRSKGPLSQSQVEVAKQIVGQKLGNSPTVPISKVEQIIKMVFKFSIPDENVVSQTHIRFISELQKSQSMMNESNTAYQVVIEKLQCERDYFQKKQIELAQKLRQLEGGFSKKGVNIKQMSKSYLQEKCSKWAMQRLKEENRILVQKIGTASQEIIKLNQNLAALQQELRKGRGFNSQGKSIVSATSIKNTSLIIENDNTRREKILQADEFGRQRQLELELKNEQLLIEITKCMTKIQQQTQTIKSFENKTEEYQQQITHKERELEDLKQSYQLVNHDYELSLKRKAAFEQECRQLKAQLSKANESLLQQREVCKNLIAQFESKEKDIVRRVKQVEQSKAEEIVRLTNKLRNAEEQRQRLMKILQENSIKKGQQMNYKTLLHEQINKLRKNNAMLDQELQLKEDRLYGAKQEQAKLEKEVKQYQIKAESSKKELARLKKQIKEQEKLIAETQQSIEQHQNLQIKILSLEQSLSILQSQFMKYKQNTERKTLVNQKTLVHLKEKFTFQMNSLLSQEAKQKNKKPTQSKLDIIDKYIEEMVALSSKTAQIKQLKQEINQLKQSKQIKSITKKGKSNSVNDSVCFLEGGILNLGTKIMEQRLAADKQLYQAKISQLNEELAKQLLLRSEMQQQLQKQRFNSHQLQTKQKQVISVEEKVKSTKMNEDKIEKLENQLKSARLNSRKLQNQNNKLESQLKTKKELLSGMKKECKEKEDELKVITNELNLLREELEKSKRYNLQAVKKQTMFKDIKQRKERIDQQNVSLKRSLQTLQERMKLLNKQLTKKDELLREMREMQDRQVRMREEGRLKEANQTIDQQKQIIRKLRCDIDRKQDILKNMKQKNEAKQKQFDELLTQKQRVIQKSSKQIQNLERKLQSQRTQSKKQENKNYQLSILVKKIFQMIVLSQKDQPKTTKIRQSTNYYSGSSVSPHQLKFASPTSQIKNIDLCQGFKILDLRPEDLQGIMGETSVLSRVSNHEQSWEMVSPILTKNDEKIREQHLLHGLQELQRLLAFKEPKNSEILQIFKRATKVQ